MTDFTNDDRDGILFRFWIRAASDWPAATAGAISHATKPEEYRKALTELAARKGVNLPAPEGNDG